MTSDEVNEYLTGFVTRPEAIAKLVSQLSEVSMDFIKRPQAERRTGRPRKYEGVVHRIGRKERRAKG